MVWRPKPSAPALSRKSRVCFENAFDRKQFQKAVRARTHNAEKLLKKLYSQRKDF